MRRGGGGGKGGKGFNRRGGGGKGGGKGKGKGKGGGAATWGNPEWRRAKLAEMEAKRPRVAIDERDMGARIATWANGSGLDDELQLTENYGREGVALIQAICGRLSEPSAPGAPAPPRLYVQQYGKGRNTVVVVAKKALAAYRADLDARHGRKEASVFLSQQDAAMLEGVLNQFDRPAAPPAAAAADSFAPSSTAAATAAAAAATTTTTTTTTTRVETALPYGGLDSWEDADEDEGGGGDATSTLPPPQATSAAAAPP